MTVQFPEDNPIVPPGTFLGVMTPEERRTETRLRARYGGTWKDRFRDSQTGALKDMKKGLDRKDAEERKKDYENILTDVERQQIDDIYAAARARG